MTNRLSHLDNLRGIAAVSVMVMHIIERLAAAGPDVVWLHQAMKFLIDDMIDLGRFGVMLFFLISGYIIPFSFKGESPIRNFVISRFFRLYPAYWFSMICALLVGWLAAYPPKSTFNILANVTMLQRLIGQSNIREGYWTLFFEMVFYIMSAGLYWRGLLGRVNVLGLLTLSLIAVAAVPPIVRAVSGVYFPAPEDSYFLAYMFLGSILRIAIVDRDPSAQRWAIGLVGCAFVAAFVLSGTFFPLAVNKTGLPPSRLVSAYILSIIIFVASIHLKRPSTRGGEWLGRVSYSLYLNQGTWLALALAFYPPTASVWQQLSFFLFVSAASLATSGLTYRYIEEPFIRMARSLTHREVPRMAQEVAP